VWLWCCAETTTTGNTACYSVTRSTVSVSTTALLGPSVGDDQVRSRNRLSLSNNDQMFASSLTTEVSFVQHLILAQKLHARDPLLRSI